MRFIDRLYMDRPELVEEKSGDLEIRNHDYNTARCPWQRGYESEDEGTAACNNGIRCWQCWKREMPGSSSSPQIDLPDDFLQEILEVCEI